MPKAPVLYVKSKKTHVGDTSFVYANPLDHDHLGHIDLKGTFRGSYRTVTEYLTDDKEALELLNQSELVYELVDLASMQWIVRLRMRMSGVRTPMLILNSKRIVGISNIKEALRALGAVK